MANYKEVIGKRREQLAYIKNKQTQAEAQRQADINAQKARGNLLATVGEFLAQAPTGLAKGSEGVYDFLNTINANIRNIPVVGKALGMGFQNIIPGYGQVGLIKDIKSLAQTGKLRSSEDIMQHTAKDYVGDYWKNPQDEFFKRAGSLISVDRKGDKWYDPVTLTREVPYSLGQMIPSIAITATTGGTAGAMLGTGYMGLSAAGGGSEEALNEGATAGQALGYGAVQGGIETAMELATGGVGRLGRVAGQPIKAAAKGIGKTILKEAASEALEEGLTEAVNPLAKTIYKGKDALKEYQDPEFFNRVKQAALIGGVTGALMQGGGEAVNIKRAGGKTQYDIALAEAEKTELAKTVDSLDSKGKLTDAQSATYTKKINEVNARIETLAGKLTVEQQSKLFKGGESIPQGFKWTESGIQRTSDVKAVKYNTQAYSASLRGAESQLKYKPIMAKATTEQQAIKNTVSKLGYKTVITSKLGKGVNAAYDKGVFYISNKLKKSDALKAVAVHEFTHTLEGTKAYSTFKRFVLENMANNPKLQAQFGKKMSFSEQVLATVNSYKDNFADFSADVAKYGYETELVSQYAEKLFSDEAQIKRLTETDANLAKKLLNWIKDKIAVIKAKKDSPEKAEMLKFLQQAEKMYSKAISESVGGISLSEMDKEVRKNKKVDGSSTQRGLQLSTRPNETINSDKIISQDNKVVNTEKAKNKHGKDVRFSKQLSFAEQVDAVVNGEHSPNFDLYVSDTPKVLTDIGFPQKPLLMQNSKIKKILTDHTEITVDILKSIPKAIEKPLLIIKSQTEPFKSVVVITEVNTAKGSMVVPVWINQDGTYFDVELSKAVFEKTNFVASAYGRNVKSLLEYAVKNNEVLYKSPETKKIGELFSTHGLQLPTPLKVSDFKISISQEKMDVKTDNDIRFAKQLIDTKKRVLTETPETPKRAFKDVAADTALNISIKFINSQAGIEAEGKRLGVKNIESLTNFARSTRSAYTHMLDKVQFDANIEKAQGKGLYAIFEQVKGDSVKENAFLDYLLNWHNIDRMKQGKPVFKARNKKEKTVTQKQSKQTVADYNAKYPDFKKIAEEVWKYNDNLLQYRVDTGLITKQQADYFRKTYPHYVPTLRAVDGKIGTKPIIGTGNLLVTNAIKKAEGGSSDILPIDVSMANYTKAVIGKGRMNELLAELYDAAIEKKDFKNIEIQLEEDIDILETTYDDTYDKANEVSFYRGGKRVTMKVSPQIFDGIRALSPAPMETPNPVLNVSRKINQQFKKLVTSYSPFFLIRNVVRDLQDVGIYTKYTWKEFLKNYKKAFNEIRKNGELWQRYQASGGFASSVFDAGYETGAKRMQKKNLLSKILSKIEMANLVTEQLPRFTEFMSSVEAGNTTKQALLDAADVTVNFGRSGTLVKQLNSTLVPFLNASVQGFSKLYRTIVGRKSINEWFTLIARVVILGIATTALNDLLNDDDEEYQNLNNRDKDNNYLFKIGGVFLKLPKGRVNGVVGSAYLRAKSAIKGDKKAFDGFWQNTVSQLTPIDSMSRTIFSPIIKDLPSNTTWYGGTIEGRKFDNVAPKDRYDESTSEIAKFLGKAFNYSPKKIHYLLDQYSGVIGDIILPATTPKAERNIFEQNFTIDPKLQNKISQTFYDELEAANFDKTAGSGIGAAKVRYLNRISGEVSDLYKKKREIENSNLTTAEKKAESKTIQVLINQIQKTALIDIIGFEEKLNSYELNTEDEKAFDVDYRNAYKDYFGAEATLKNYNKSVYEKAVYFDKAKIDFDSFYKYYFDLQQIEADKDRAGNAISNSRKTKVEAYISKLRLKAAQKYMLLNLAGYTSTTGKTEIEKYLISLRLSVSERKEILKKLGY